MSPGDNMCGPPPLFPLGGCPTLTYTVYHLHGLALIKPPLRTTPSIKSEYFFSLLMLRNKKIYTKQIRGRPSPHVPQHQHNNMTAPQVLDFLEQHASTSVAASALHGGTFTLPLKLFIASATDKDRSTVPSLAFLIVHTDNNTGKKTKTIFDLGLRRETENYIAPIRQHLTTRQPLDTSLDVRQSLLNGGVHPQDISNVIVSHVHWDHTGTPADYPEAQFWVGSGALDVLANGLGGHLGHQHFESELFSGVDVKEFPSPPRDSDAAGNDKGEEGGWQKVGDFLLYDFMGDGSIYIVDSPGHLPGHVNLLARLGPKRWIYLVGDACHDRRLLTGEEGIAEWQDAEGRFCCIHTDKKQAEATLKKIRELQAAAAKQEGFALEVILAHAMDWAEANKGAFLPGVISSS